MPKLKRYKQWLQALRRANLSLRQWATLLTIPFTERRATRRTWRRRMSQCVRCPIYNHEHKTCMLCDCYMPIKAAFAEQQCAGEIDGVSSARGWTYREPEFPACVIKQSTSYRYIKSVDSDGYIEFGECTHQHFEPTEVEELAHEASALTSFGASETKRIVAHLSQNVGRRRGVSSLDMLVEAAIARGRDGVQIINDQQKENDE